MIDPQFKAPSICYGAPSEGLYALPSLPAVLLRAAQTAAGVRYLHSDGTEQFQRYCELAGQAQRILQGMAAAGVQSGDRVVLQIASPAEFLATLWACWLGRIVAIPVTIPPRYSLEEAKAAQLRSILTLVEPSLIVVSPSLFEAVQAFLEEGDRLVSVDALTGDALEALTGDALDDALTTEPFNPSEGQAPGAIAPVSHPVLILFTSGSTGTPKGVTLTEHNLLASAYGMATVNHLTSHSITLNWMPLEHVASLVMFHVTEVYLGCQQIHVANDYVLQDPLRWIDLLDRYRVTATWAPNFAYGLIHQRVNDLAQRPWDLSCVQWMGNGAEAVVGKTTRIFLEVLAPYGLAKTAVSPGYGMSETCSGIVHSHDFWAADQDAPFVEVGTPIPGIELRIVDEQQQVVPEETVGQLQVRGVTVTPGYYGHPGLNAELFTADGWFNTGDLGFLRRGRLTITGRQKDVIILNGVNLYSHDVEAVVEELAEVEASFTAACSVRRSSETSDQLAIFFHPTGEDWELVSLIQRVRRQVLQRLGVNPSYVIPVERSAIPKTAIGKIQRSELSRQFQAGCFDEVLAQIAAVFQQRSILRPRNPIEQELTSIWQSVLGLERVGTEDHFFELGGSSLHLVQVVHQMEQRGYRVSVVDLFQYSTIASLAEFLRQPTPPQSEHQGQHRAQRRRAAQAETAQAGIAVIGMAGRFPGAASIDQFWANLRDGVESITFFSDEEMQAAGVDPHLLQHPHYVKASPVLENVDGFDAEFFGYTPREAELLDPQQRLMLECAWEALEDAGYNPFRYAAEGGAIALYAGAAMNTYVLNQVYPNRDRLDENDSLGVVTLSSLGGFQLAVANDKDYLTTRVSYKLNLTGASVNVQTACSTSLVAIHLASQALRHGECDLALAGGVSVHVPQAVGHLYQEGMILSPDGHCRAFDARAQGTIFGSGAGVVVLKRLDDALTDGDQIYAVIKGSAIGNDGGSKVGYFAPRAEGQSTVISEALAIAGVTADSISYVEAHGTGTELGDPIELSALTRAFRSDTTRSQFCALGSVKTNVGHLNVASGVVGFMKTVLALHHRALPASLHFETPNPQLDLPNSPFFVNTELRPWQSQGSPRRAGVNSLGIGGTNAHVILEEAPPRPVPLAVVEDRPCHVLTLSAKTPIALQALADRYLTVLSTHPDLPLADLCFTANAGRVSFPYRLALVANSIAEVQAQLHDWLAQPQVQPTPSSPTLALLFTGKGVPSLAVGQYLYRTQPVVQQAIARCSALFQTSVGRPHREPTHREPTHLRQPHLEQLLESDRPSLEHPSPWLQFALEYALFELWQSWGVKPDVVAGHGVGAYLAAIAAGVFPLEDALALVVQQETALEQVARRVVYQPPTLPLLLPGDPTPAEMTADYWAQPLAHPEMPGAIALEQFHAAGVTVVLQCGSPAAEPSFPGEQPIPRWLTSLSPGQSPILTLLTALKDLYLHGIEIDWAGVDRPYPRQRCSLPTYPFQRQRYWLEARPIAAIAPAPPEVHPLLGQKMSTPRATLFTASMGCSTLPFLSDHRLHGAVVLPGAAYLEMALAAGSLLLPAAPLEVTNVTLHRAMVLSETPHSVQMSVSRHGTELSLEIHRQDRDEADSWTLHCTGTVSALGDGAQPQDFLSVRQRFRPESTPAEGLDPVPGLEYGATFRGVQQVWRRSGEVLATVQLPPCLQPQAPQYHIHPALLDACLQVIGAIAPSNPYPYVPVSCDRLCSYQRPTSDLWSHVTLQTLTPEGLIVDVTLYDHSGNVVLSLAGLTARIAPPPALEHPPSWRQWLQVPTWLPSPLPTVVNPSEPGHWLILADRQGIGRQLAQRLEAQHHTCTIRTLAEENAPLETLITSVQNSDQNGDRPLRGVVYLDGLEARSPEDATPLCTRALHLAQALLRCGVRVPLWFVTQGSQSLHIQHHGIAQAPLWALGKTIALEHPDLPCRCVDLGNEPVQDIDLLCQELQSGASDRQISFCAGVRYTTSIPAGESMGTSTGTFTGTSTGASTGTRALLPPDDTQTLQLHQNERGQLDQLEWRSQPRRRPQPHDIELRVLATGLNFRDVLNALGRYPGEAGPLGLECVGEVVAVGPQVDGLQIGDVVLALAPHSFSQFVTVPARRVVRKPEALSPTAAATLPVAFLTAHYALNVIARLKRGDRVLIHAAAGGVGLAAVQMAQRVGAEVFATASPGKWAHLQRLGVTHLYHSRSYDFVEAIWQDTEDQGVDVVLNALSGDFIHKSASLLRRGGHFVEIGKPDAAQVELVKQIRPDLNYTLLDLMQETERHPERLQTMLSEIVEKAAQGVLQPLPCTLFSRDRVVAAFRYMQQARHVGKVVVTILPPQFRCHPEGFYAITGAFGGLGQRLTQFLIHQGAKHLVLIGRTPPAPALQAAIAQWQQSGVDIITAPVDVADREALTRLLVSHCPFERSRLRGVFHAAGVLADAALENQTQQKFELVIAAKLQGAWNLHQLTQDLPLDCFVLFSSAASLLGSAGQANYAAANASLDALAHYRHALGLRALSVNWGPWGEVGMAARHTASHRFIQKGIAPLDPDTGLTILQCLLSESLPQVAVFPPSVPPAPGQPTVAAVPRSWLEQLAQWPEHQRLPALMDGLRQTIARVLGLNPSQIEPEQGLSDLGLDSLTSVELTQQLQKQFHASLPTTLLYNYGTLAALTRYFLDRLGWLTNGNGTPASPGDAPNEFASLSEAEAEALLLNELDRLNL